MAVGKSATGKNISDKPGETPGGTNNRGSAGGTSLGGAAQRSFNNQSQRKASGGPGSGSETKSDAANRQQPSTGKQTESDSNPQDKASQRNELMKAGLMREYKRRGEIDMGLHPGATPGATASFPNADLLTIVEKIGLPAALAPVPGANLALAAMTAAQAALEGDITKHTSLLGGDPGPQKGWQADRFKGKANMTGVGDPGSANGTVWDEREIAGRPLRAMPNDSSVNETPSTGTGTGVYSDVMMADRRRPGLKQMLETML